MSESIRQTMRIAQSVGKNGVNQRDDVKTVQVLLNANIGKVVPLAPVPVDGQLTPATIRLIEEFQRRVVRMSLPDGRVDSAGKTLLRLNEGTLGKPESEELEGALEDLKTQSINFGSRFIKDARVRSGYVRETEFVAKVIREEVMAGRLTPREGAREANKIRNAIMEAARVESSDLGRAIAVAKKQVGKSLPELESRYASELFGKEFESLAKVEKNQVWLEIVESAGRADPKMSLKIARLSKLGKGLAFVAVACAVYNVATAENKGRQLAKEGVTAGAGMIGGAVAAGLLCGPGAPVCVGVAIFVGGGLSALGADIGFDWLTR